MTKSMAEYKRDQRARDKLPGSKFEKAYRATKTEHGKLYAYLKKLRAALTKGEKAK
jgi:hypothetical protein